MITMKKHFFPLVVLCILLFIIPFSSSAEIHDSHPDIPVCAVYFTGIGCPHCAKVEPFAKDLLEEYPNLVLLKYEIYQEQQNAPLLTTYASNYGIDRPGIPLIIFNNVAFSPFITLIKCLKPLDSLPCSSSFKTGTPFLGFCFSSFLYNSSVTDMVTPFRSP